MWDWQQLLVYGVVAVAAVYLLLGFFRKKAGCGGCHSCPSSKVDPNEAPSPQLVQLELTPRKEEASPRSTGTPLHR